MLGRLLVLTKKDIEKERVRRGIFTLSPSLSHWCEYHTLTHTNTHVHTHIHSHSCTDTQAHTHAHIHAQTLKHPHSSTHLHTQTHTFMLTNTHTHTHTHTLTHLHPLSLSFFHHISRSFSLSFPFSSNPTNSRLFCFNCETRIAFVFHFDAMNEKREKERDHSSTFWETRDAFIAKMPPKEPNLKSLEQLWLWLLLGSRRSCSVVAEHTTGDEMVLGSNPTRAFSSSSSFFSRFP